jgi:hypothetical protein
MPQTKRCGAREMNRTCAEQWMDAGNGSFDAGSEGSGNARVAPAELPCTCAYACVRAGRDVSAGAGPARCEPVARVAYASASGTAATSAAMRGVRGATAHANGAGCEIALELMSGTGSGAPGAGRIANAASESAHASQTDASARCWPGQMRRPKPNTSSRGSRSGETPRKRSGRNASGST